MSSATDEPLITVAQRIQQRMTALRASERKVARALLADYPVAGLETVASLATVAGVSAPTVTRFAARLGYDGFPDLQRELRRELNNLMGSPLVQYPSDGRLGAAPGHGPARLVESALDALVPEDLERAATLLAIRGRVFIVAGRFSRGLADYLYFHLLMLRQSVSIGQDDQLQLANHTASLGRQDVLVLFDYRRYDETNVRLARSAHQRGTSVVLFTDVWLSPASDFADVVLPSPVAAVDAFDSLLGSMAVADQLIRATAAELGGSGRAHLKDLEKLREELGLDHPSELSGGAASS